MMTGDLLRRMADAYAGAKTYADRGRAQYRHISGTSRSEDQKTFATFLDREHGFRFDALEGSSNNQVIVWSGQGPALIAHHDRSNIDRFVKSLLIGPFCHFGPAVAMGVLSLLFPKDFGRSFLDDFRDPLYQGQALIGTARCHRVLGHCHDRTEVTLWLDEEHYLVRQLVDRTEYPWGREAAELRDAHIRRRDHALAAGIPRNEVEQAFGPEQLLAIKHWPYARPREDSRRITRVAYDPQVGIPIDAGVFESKSTRV
jgi:hypothetical protein